LLSAIALVAIVIVAMLAFVAVRVMGVVRVLRLLRGAGRLRLIDVRVPADSLNRHIPCPFLANTGRRAM
jgi:hypothetical protein